MSALKKDPWLYLYGSSVRPLVFPWFSVLSLCDICLLQTQCNGDERNVVCGAHSIEKKYILYILKATCLSRRKYSGYSGESTDHTVNNFHWKTFKSWAPQTKCHLPPLYLGCGRNISAWYLKISADKTNTIWGNLGELTVSPLSCLILNPLTHSLLPYFLFPHRLFPQIFPVGYFSLTDSITSSRCPDAVHVISASHR